MTLNEPNDSRALINWYRSVRRELPWRLNKDPYRIWISEVMLQQTTVAAVVPFYEKFMKRFPNVKSLASAPLEDVLEYWAGLGYYSRAKNLHRSAQILAKSGFPKTHSELIELPGFGPYTSRAVASLAFGEKTGVLDGNVIRILSRRFGIKHKWWSPQGRIELQKIADQLAQVEDPSDLNQAMMELGATICTPQSPACLLCPWAKVCVGREKNLIQKLPLKKPRRQRESWAWHPMIIKRNGRVLCVENTYAPFLKGHWILPGSVELLKTPPKAFDFRGTVTHHDIFVTLMRDKRLKPPSKIGTKWVTLANLKREIPASLVRKAIELSVD
jgi:A/G-specific adenine glycosylase